MLYILKPVITLAPTAVKMKPPTIAPTMPSTMSRKKPSPDLLTILLAMKPEISPRMIHPMIDITHLLTWIACPGEQREAGPVQFVAPVEPCAVSRTVVGWGFAEHRKFVRA